MPEIKFPYFIFIFFHHDTSGKSSRSNFVGVAFGLVQQVGDWLHNLQDPVENENVEPLVRKLRKDQDGDSGILNQEWASKE